MTISYIEAPLSTYLDDAASGKQTPGGGSVAALTGSLAAAMGTIVTAFTINSNKYSSVHQRFTELQETIEKLTAADPDRDLRQVGIVSARGDAATFTGKKCHDWAGGRTGEHYAAQGNILVSAATVNAIADTFEQTSGTLAERLLAALSAAKVPRPIRQP